MIFKRKTIIDKINDAHESFREAYHRFSKVQKDVSQQIVWLKGNTEEETIEELEQRQENIFEPISTPAYTHMQTYDLKNTIIAFELKLGRCEEVLEMLNSSTPGYSGVTRQDISSLSGEIFPSKEYREEHGSFRISRSLSAGEEFQAKVVLFDALKQIEKDIKYTEALQELMSGDEAPQRIQNMTDKVIEQTSLMNELLEEIEILVNFHKNQQEEGKSEDLLEKYDRVSPEIMRVAEDL